MNIPIGDEWGRSRGMSPLGHIPRYFFTYMYPTKSSYIFPSCVISLLIP